jgi:hypothetical protein
MMTVDACGSASARNGRLPPRARVPAGLTTATLVAALIVIEGAAPASAASQATEVVSAPDSIQFAQLRLVTSKPQTIRLRGSFGTQEIERPWFDSTGVSSEEPEWHSYRRPGLIVGGVAPQPLAPQPIAWSEISEIQTGHAMVGRGALAGFFVGVGLATVALHSSDLTESEAYEALSASLAVITLTTVTGMIVGSRCGWRTIYKPNATQQP